MSIYSGSIQLGIAAGFVFGETVATALDSWRWPYVIEVIVMSVLTSVLLFVEKDPCFIQKKRTDELLETGEVNSLGEQLKQLLTNSTYVWLCLGQAAFMFTAGAVAFWCTDYQIQHYGVSALQAAVVLSCVVVCSGLAGTLLGSALADFLLRPIQSAYDRGTLSDKLLQSERTKIAGSMLGVVTFIGACAGTAGAIADTYTVFVVTFALAVFTISFANGPLSLAIVSIVQPEVRGQSVAVHAFLYHLLGDFPSPYVIGWVIQSWGMYWGYLITQGWLFLAAFAWSIAAIIVRRASKEAHSAAPTEVSLEPLNS